MKQAETCRPICTEGDCITVNQDRVDFKTAEAACRGRSAELLTLHPEADESILHTLSQELAGHFWIGLRLPAGACSNLSSPLRGYEWISGGTHRSFVAFPGTWRDSVQVCSPHCVSLSDDQKWTERRCSDRADGYLCRTKHKDACRAQELSDPTVFQSPKGCSTGPCEHECTNVKGGYKCSCFRGYIPDSKDPRQCKLHCGKQKCPCNRQTGSACYCPEGFIRDEDFCLDINECERGDCDQECKNLFGTFQCSCRQGFVLKDNSKCIKAEAGESFPITTVGPVKPDDNTPKTSSAPTGGLLWIWILTAVAVVVFICVVRFYVVKRQKRREQNSSQPSPAPVDNIDC
ncbi:hypothetical protein F2P81_003761 [Scophthalmus maximus]|nr:hypothetical protein F2P81_003761 [Scophthalmus maximus]